MDTQEMLQILHERAHQAYDELSSCINLHDTYVLDKYVQALNMVIQEIENRVGCEYCNGSLTIGRGMHDITGTCSVAIHRGRSELLIYDDELIGDIDINYCPICGRKLW